MNADRSGSPNSFAEFAKTNFSGMFSSPWRPNQRRLIDAIERLPAEPVRHAQWVYRAEGTSTTLLTAALWLVVCRGVKAVLFVPPTQWAAEMAIAYILDFFLCDSFVEKFGPFEVRRQGRTLRINDSIIAAESLHGGLRGLQWQFPDGQKRRPEVVLIDHFVTQADSESATYREEALQRLNKTIPALGSPARLVSILMATSDCRFIPSWSK